MHSRSTPRGAIVTREASLALLEFKTLVDSTAEKIRAAEREAVGFAIGQRHGGDPLRALRVVAEALKSPDFEAALSQARSKTDTAVAWHSGEQGQQEELCS